MKLATLDILSVARGTLKMRATLDRCGQRPTGTKCLSYPLLLIGNSLFPRLGRVMCRTHQREGGLHHTPITKFCGSRHSFVRKEVVKRQTRSLSPLGLDGQDVSFSSTSFLSETGFSDGSRASFQRSYFE